MARIPHFPRPCGMSANRSPRPTQIAPLNPQSRTSYPKLAIEGGKNLATSTCSALCLLLSVSLKHQLMQREKTTRSHLQRKGFKPQRNSSDSSACFRLHRKALAAISFLTKFTPLSVHRCRMQPCDSCRSQLFVFKMPSHFLIWD